MDHRKPGELPPLPVPPRSLTPPERRSFTLEADTPARNPTAAHFASLASVFDELTPAQRNDFVELGFVFRSISDEQRRELLDRALVMGGFA